jgi:predicted DNA-binding antitoxin AbrB/MazE fold protein
MGEQKLQKIDLRRGENVRKETKIENGKEN